MGGRIAEEYLHLMTRDLYDFKRSVDPYFLSTTSISGRNGFELSYS